MKYFIYTRKSTDSEERQVLSIEAQLAELKEFASKEKLEIVASLRVAKTAKEPGRTEFDEMLARIEKGEAKGILGLGIMIDWLEILLTEEQLFICWTQERSKI
jgi:DNA invertase Pin-like site-specific DNA recombinase